ncbi:MAG: acyl-CoA dehydrogenase [Alphaproteobacteria bacterium]|nr:acyl-CoA dehydrogenase [Alphaproteobacteria bacterium]MBU2337080.1 acyl-CoA dehydrogenase [Alphaproteobacteria bacterium]
MLLPLEYGGHPDAQTAMGRASIYSRLGAADPGLTIALPGPGLALPPVLALATPEQRANFFGRFQRDRPTWAAFAITEADAGSDATALTMVAEERGDHFVLNGSKYFITNGGRAEVVIVFATVDRKRGRFGIKAFMVDAASEGFSVDRTEDMLGLRSSQLAVLTMKDCKVPKECLLGGERRADSFTGAQASWDYMRPLLSSLIVGTTMRNLETICGAFEADGTPGRRRARQISCSGLRARVHMAWQLVLKAAWMFDHAGGSALDSSMAKAAAASVAAEVSYLACSTMQDVSLEESASLEMFVRNAKAFDILEGTGDMQRLMITKLMGGRSRGLIFGS